MRITNKNFLVFAAALMLAMIIYSAGCKREPVYIGYVEPDPVDTSGGVDPPPPPPVTHPCSPDSVYFAQDILPILTSNCAMTGCHNVQSHEDGVILNNYTNVRNTGKINLGSPSNSKLYRVLNDSGGDRMPPAPAAALPTAQRALILKWIQQGALNLSCDADCDTTNVTFATSVMPIITLKCKGCHSGATPSGSIALTNYAQVKATVTSGTLIGSITHQVGYAAMPDPAGSPKLPDCDIRKIQIWIEHGALNE